MQVKCPNCKKTVKWEGNPWRPFCSERCKLVDLGAWASEDYRVADEDDYADSVEDTEPSNSSKNYLM